MAAAGSGDAMPPVSQADSATGLARRANKGHVVLPPGSIVTPNIVLIPNMQTQIEMLKRTPEDHEPDGNYYVEQPPTQEDLKYIREITASIPPVPLTAQQTDLISDPKTHHMGVLSKELRAEVTKDTKILLETTDKRISCSGCQNLFLKSRLLPMQPEVDDWQGYFVRLCFDCLQCKDTDEPLRADKPDDAILRDDQGPGETMTEDDMARREKVKKADLVPRLKSAWRTLGWRSVASSDDPIVPVRIPPPTAPAAEPRPSADTGSAQEAEGKWRRQPAFKGTAEEQQRQFKRAVAHAWQVVMALRKGNFHIRVRAMSFERVLARLAQDYPGENRAQLRQRLANDAKSFAASFVSAALALDAEQRKRVREAFDKFEEAHAAKAHDPNHMTQLAQDTFAPERFSQFLDEINGNMLEHFICRDPGCAHFMPSDMWITNGSKYRCPFCFTLYQPWAEKTGRSGKRWIPAQKIMAVRRTINEGTGAVYDESNAVKVKIGGEEGAATDYNFFLTTWPDSVTTQLINELKMVWAGLAMKMATMSADETMASVAEVALKYRNQTYFRSEYVPTSVLQEMNDANEKSTKKWSTAHLPVVEGKPYVHCATYTYEDETYILNAQDLLNMWSHMKWAMTVAMTVKL